MTEPRGGPAALAGGAVVADEVAAALTRGRAVVALESTLLAHGLPAPRNREVAAGLEAVVRAAGAVPATIAVLDGRFLIGLSTSELDRVCDPAAGLAKLSLRDLGPAAALGLDGATTVASTSALARAAGIQVFGTGGLGGVHLSDAATASWDVSADLDVLANTPILVVCSGVKSILDIAATVEVLETRSIPVIGYRTDQFPAFYRRASDHSVPWRVDSPEAAAEVALAHFGRVPARSGLLVVNPVPPEHELASDLHDRLLAEGMALVERRGVRGGAVTPVLLAHFHSASGGASLATNEALVLDNARVAAEIAVAMSAQRGREPV